MTPKVPSAGISCGILFCVSRYTASISDRQVRALKQVHGLLELFPQSELVDTDSTGYAEKEV